MTSDYTNASDRCQRAKVCPKGLSVNTMLCDVEAPIRYSSNIARKDRRDLFAQPSVVENQRANHRPSTIGEFFRNTASKIIDTVFGRVGDVSVAA